MDTSTHTTNLVSPTPVTPVLGRSEGYGERGLGAASLAKNKKNLSSRLSERPWLRIVNRVIRKISDAARPPLCTNECIYIHTWTHT